MRIRKNANRSSLMSSHASGAEALQTHVCQLNQSPWDVIPFSQETCPVSLHQFEGQDSFNGNGSLGDSIGAAESVASMMEDGDEKAAIKKRVDSMVIDDNYEMEDKKKRSGLDDYEGMKIESEFKLKKGEKSQCCNKNDGKGWHCKNEPKEGRSLCAHHLTLLRSYSHNNNNNVGNNNITPCLGLATSSTKKQEKATNGPRRGRTKAAKKGSAVSSSNPYEFYYYSGFGPLWGKRRGDKGEGSKISEVKDIENGITSSSAAVVATSQNTTPSPSYSSPIEHTHKGFDYVDEEDDDDDEEEEENENGDSCKKRMRKPVKARSLKSLM